MVSNELLASIVLACSVIGVSAVASRKLFKGPESNDANNPQTPRYLLAGDIGGTNTRLALYHSSSRTPLMTKTYLNGGVMVDECKKFEIEFISPFLDECNLEDSCEIVACFAVAGPVANNIVKVTNTQACITLDGNLVEKSQQGPLRLIRRCKIVNDFVGQGYGVVDLISDEDFKDKVVPLTPNSFDLLFDEQNKGPKVCVGAGTGLGECYLATSSLHPDEGYECYPSEGGHVEFVPRSALEIKLLEYLKQKFNSKHRVSVERVVSGKGLANTYEFLASEFPEKVNQDIHKDFLNAGDMQGRVIGEQAHLSESKERCLCRQALEIMMSAYGSEVGSAALKFIPTGGMFVTGGLTPKNIKMIKGDDSPFMKAYKDKGRLSGLLDTIPLFAVLEEDLGLRGARYCAQREFNNLHK